MKRIPFCPHSDCENHDRKCSKNWFIRLGSYRTKTFGTVQRYMCKTCYRTFSDQTFKIDYYAKKKVNYRLLMNYIVSKTGIRSMSRFLTVSTETIQNKISRLARQALVMHERCKQDIQLQENLTADGFESFAVSQYYPDNITILVGKESQFVYSLDYTTIRRKGRMTEDQKQKREELEKKFKPDSGGIKKSFSNILDVVARLADSKLFPDLRFYTDKKKDYKRAISAHPILSKLKDFTHITISSKEARTTRNDLFAVNYIDREYRKGLANHVRETMEFTRNVNDGMNRLVIYNTYHNYYKNYRIGEGAEKKFHAEVAGIRRNTIKKNKEILLTERAFISLDPIDNLSKNVWFRKYTTPLKSGTEYYPSFIRA